MTYVVDFGDNIKTEVQVPKEECSKVDTTVLAHQYTRAGTFIATLTTKPASGGGVTLSRITITAKDPAATSGTKTATFTTSPIAGAFPLNVTFALSASDSEIPSVNYAVVFGDGQIETFPQTASPKISHVYSNPGTYVVNVVKKTQCSPTGCLGATTPVGTVTITAH
jgi:PKD repeat protein